MSTYQDDLLRRINFNYDDEIVIYNILLNNGFKQARGLLFVTNYLNIGVCGTCSDGYMEDREKYWHKTSYLSFKEKITESMSENLSSFIDENKNLKFYNLGSGEDRLNLFYRIEQLITEFLLLNRFTHDEEQKKTFGFITEKLNGNDALLNDIDCDVNDMIKELKEIKDRLNKFDEALKLQLNENHNLMEIIKQNQCHVNKLVQELDENKSKLVSEQTKNKIMLVEMNEIRQNMNSTASDSFREYNKLLVENYNLRREINELKQVSR